jgi:hypothetical protein
MNKLTVSVLLAASCCLVFAGCSSDKSSNEACLHEVTMNLDHGNYDEVLASSCADSMQKGAAYFGKAGYDITTVINSFIDAGDETSSESALDIYLNALAANIDDETISNLENAELAYTDYAAAFTPDTDEYLDSQFNLSLVNAVKGISLLKFVTSDLGASALDKSCDWNGNGTADSVDAAVCALNIASGLNCEASIFKTSAPGIRVEGKEATYTGYIIRVNEAGIPDKTGCPDNNLYYRLLNQTGTSVAATTSSTCNQTFPPITDTRPWPCPIEANGVPLGLAESFDESLSGSITSLSIAVTNPESADVKDSIIDIKADNCCPELLGSNQEENRATVGNDPAACACSSSDLSAYLGTL